MPWPDTRTDAGSGTARIVFAPERSGTPLAELSLDDGERLVVCDRQRWLAGRDRSEVASQLLPEDGLAVTKLPDGSFRFLGRSGALFESKTALGPVERIVGAVDGAAHTVLSGARAVVVTGDGRLLFSRDGRTYAPRPLGRRVQDVALFDGGFGVALTFPEQLFRTDDGGDTWAPWDAKRVGAQSLQKLLGDRVGALGPSATTVLDAKSGASTRSTAPPVVPIEFVAKGVRLFPAELLEPGRSFALGGVAFAALRPTTRGKPWALVRGKVGEQAVVEDLVATEKCVDLALSGDAEVLTAVCLMDGRRAPEAHLLRWTRTSDPPSEHASVLKARRGETRVFHLPGGGLLLSGVCLETAKTCDPSTLFRTTGWIERPAKRDAPPEDLVPFARGRDRDATEKTPAKEEDPGPFQPIRLAELAGSPTAIAVSQGRIFVVGRRQKGGREALWSVPPDGPPVALDFDFAAPRPARRTVLSPTADGGAVVAFDGAFAAFATVDAKGRIVAVNPVPAATAATRLGVFGRKGLVVDRERLSETHDAGATFASGGSVTGLLQGTAVSCLAEGCFLGHELARVGWGGEIPRPPSPERPLVDEPRTPAPPPPPGLVCTVSRDAWAPLPEGARVPTAGDADVGKPAWAVLVERNDTAAASMFHGTRAGTLEEVQLLAPIKKPAGVAVARLAQLEGGIAVRAKVGDARKDGDVPLRDLEVAWENLVTEKVVRGRLADVGTTLPGSLVPLAPGVFQLPAPVLSVVSTGAFVRLDLTSPGRSRFSSFDEKGVPTPLEGVELPPPGTAGDWVSLGGRPFLWFLQGGHLKGLTGRTEDLLAVGPDAGVLPGFFAVQTYKDGRPLLTVGGPSDAGGDRASVFAYPLGASGFGAAIELPTQRAHVAAKRRVCSADERKRTARAVAPPEPGTRRAMAIRAPDGAELAMLRSGRRILHGSATDPCETVEEGEPVDPSSTSGVVSALFFPGDPEHGWVFRLVGERVQARTMKCREDAKVSLD